MRYDYRFTEWIKLALVDYSISDNSMFMHQYKLILNLLYTKYFWFRDIPTSP